MKQRRFVTPRLLKPQVRIRMLCFAAKAGKRRYRTETAAQAALASQRAAYAAGHPGAKRECVRVYACPACGGWHLTAWSSERPWSEARAA